MRSSQRDVQEGNSENEMDLKSKKQDQGLNQNDSEFRSYLNTNHSKIIGLTEDTSRTMNSGISSQVSRHPEELKTDVKAQILDVINSAIAGKVLPLLENALKPNKCNMNAKWDLRSDGPHPSKIGQMAQQRDLMSDGLHFRRNGQMVQLCDLSAVQTDCIQERMTKQLSNAT